MIVDYEKIDSEGNLSDFIAELEDVRFRKPAGVPAHAEFCGFYGHGVSVTSQNLDEVLIGAVRFQESLPS